MIINIDPDALVPVSSQRICGFHQRHPGSAYAGCSCTGFYGYRPATKEERDANRRKRLGARERALASELAKVRSDLGRWEDDG